MIAAGSAIARWARLRSLSFVPGRALVRACAFGLFVAGCKSQAPGAVVEAGPTPSVSASLASTVVGPTSTSPPTVGSAPEPPPFDDACTTHADCVALDHFVDPDWRCCLGCGGTIASSQAWAKVFLAYCADTRAMRDCPVPQCDAGTAAARCIAGHCALLPGKKL